MATLSQPTIDELITETRNMLNQPNASNSFWTDEELTAYLNEGVRRYFVECVKHAEGQFTTSSDLNITSGTQTIALPADFFTMKNVWRTRPDGYEKMFYRNNVTEGYRTNAGDLSALDYSYRGNNLLLSSVPGFSETAGIKIEYVQFPETMFTGGDSMTSQVSPVFRDLVIMYAVYKAKVKESLVNGANTASLALQNLNDLFTAFQQIISGRDATPTAVIPFNPEDC